MNTQLDQRKLWAALSYAFIDAETDYKYIASVAKKFSREQVEFAFFERVAPVCIYNIFTPAPPVWCFFEESELFDDIEILIKKRAKQGILGKSVCILNGWLIRIICQSIWKRIRTETERDDT